MPSALIKLYLSSSNGKNVVLSPAVTAPVNASVEALIATLNIFLIARVASLKSTSDMRDFGRGVKRVSSSDFSNGLDIKVRSETVDGFLYQWLLVVHHKYQLQLLHQLQ